MDVHQHLLALLRMTVFGIVFAFGSESSEEMSRFMSHRAIGPAVRDQRDALFDIGGARRQSLRLSLSEREKTSTRSLNHVRPEIL